MKNMKQPTVNRDLTTCIPLECKNRDLIPLYMGGTSWNIFQKFLGCYDPA